MTPAAILTRILLVAALVAGVYAAFRHYEDLVGDLADTRNNLTRTEKALEVAIDAATAEREDHERSMQLLAGRQRQAATLAKERDHYAQLLANAQRDPVARQWLDADVPRAVWCGLRNRPPGVDCNPVSPGDPARTAPGGDAQPRTAGHHGLRLDYLLASPRGRPGQLQRGQGDLARVGG